MALKLLDISGIKNFVFSTTLLHQNHYCKYSTNLQNKVPFYFDVYILSSKFCSQSTLSLQWAFRTHQNLQQARKPSGSVHRTQAVSTAPCSTTRVCANHLERSRINRSRWTDIPRPSTRTTQSPERKHNRVLHTAIDIQIPTQQTHKHTNKRPGSLPNKNGFL